MAPEQARGKSVDRRADIWAFGFVSRARYTSPMPPAPSFSMTRYDPNTWSITGVLHGCYAKISP
jgi:hypothetical protein